MRIRRFYLHYLWKKRQKKGHKRFHTERIYVLNSNDSGISISVHIPNGLRLDRTKFPLKGEDIIINGFTITPVGFMGATEEGTYHFSFHYKIDKSGVQNFSETIRVVKE